MDKPIIDDELRKRIETLLPQPKPRREKYPGRKPVPDCAALSGILLVLRTEHGSGLGKYRWVVERTHAWFHNFHRLRVRYERLAKIHEAFLKFAACLICWSTLQRSIQPF